MPNVPRFSPLTLQRFSRNLIEKLLTAAEPVALAAIPSEQLKEQLRPRIHNRFSGDLFITSYWAIFVHDGHGPISPVRARFLVYYRDRANDPRRPDGRTPDRLSEERRLTRSEFQHGIAENRRLRQLNPGAGPSQFMLIVKDKDGRPMSSGPAKAQPFFETGMLPFENIAEDLIYTELDRFVRGMLGKESKKAPIVLEL